VLQYRGKTELINGTASGGIVGGLIGLRGMCESCIEMTHQNSNRLKQRKSNRRQSKMATECKVKVATDLNCESQDGDTEVYRIEK